MDGNPVNPFSWQNELGQWTKTQGLQNYLGTGLQDSTIGKSGFFDQATQQAQALRAQNLAQAAQAIGAAPVAGIDPAAAVAASQQAQANALAQRNAARQGGLQGAQKNLQSTTDWINQMMGATSQAVNKEQQEWQNYQQAMMQAAAQNQASISGMIGAGIGALGTIGGAAVGGPIGAAVGGSLGGLASKAVMPAGGFTPMSSAPASIQQKYGWYSGPSNNY